jgi:hypothetical protein
MQLMRVLPGFIMFCPVFLFLVNCLSGKVESKANIGVLGTNPKYSFPHVELLSREA